ncbi:MAG: class I SAM-dependent methyltransferase [Arenimonas sp.]|uniref:class I SAM-dependent methyltransferase n=1 Tax=Arenimonas sp. TaxID=1872635 RepID=UPI0025C22C43|nr:class I SAM-dependent methyltransferase [Arenimonas sp.]MBW8366782.1 class I SAM-dependent methyltransferase [Arenimonas sp.]
MSFQDHFSGHAGDYATARPTYPPELFQWLADQCLHHDLVWDVGCGNGQASLALAHHFRRVHASDPSAEQIANAPEDPRITWRVESAEICSLHNHSVDLVTAAQAFHWFNQGRFGAEAQRVLRPGGVVAVWCYGQSRVDGPVDAVFHELYENQLGPYWPPERRHVENGYRALSFPFEVIADAPRFSMEQSWALDQYLAYLRTWSASQRCLRETGRDAVSDLADDFARAWGDPAKARTVRWHLSLRAGRTASD